MAADKYTRLGERLFRIAPDGLERGKMFELVSCQQVGSRFHVVEWASPVWRCHDSFRIEQGKRVEPKRFGQAKMAKQGCGGDPIDAQSKIIGIAVDRLEERRVGQELVSKCRFRW